MLSEATRLGRVNIPAFQGLGVMMMPFRWDDPARTLTARQIGGWVDTIEDLCWLVPSEGIGYVTIDERVVPEGQTHRRPGWHVDGHGVWGAPSPYGRGGMILLSSTVGAEYVTGDIDVHPDAEGGCDTFIGEGDRMEAGVAYWCAPMCLHRSVPMQQTTRRQLLRLSMPSMEPHHWPFTPNETGVQPVTPRGPDRSTFMAYRGRRTGD
jgi:hypothetical protein